MAELKSVPSANFQNIDKVTSKETFDTLLRAHYDSNIVVSKYMTRVKEVNILSKEDIAQELKDYGDMVTPEYQTRIICALAKAAGGNAFEFGTWNGNTTNLIADNILGDVYSLDIDAQSELNRENPRVHFLRGDSLTFNYSQFVGRMSFVFVDGCHNFKEAENDTRWAFKLIETQTSAIIVWHDYQHANDGYDVEKLLNCLAEYVPLNYIENSSLVFYQRGLNF